MRSSYVAVAGIVVAWVLMGLSSGAVAQSEPQPDTSRSSTAPRREFKFYLKSEPHGLDPIHMTGGEQAYLFGNLYRGLTRYAGGGELVYDMAERCRYILPTEIQCTLRKNALWNDKAPVTAQQFVDSFRRIVSPQSQCPVLNLLLGLKNASDVYAGKKKVEALGVTAVSPREIKFTLEAPDSEFLEKLSNPLLVPFRQPKNSDDKSSYFFNGPYQVKAWEHSHRIELESNSNYPFGNPARPPVEIIFVADDSAAITLYEKGVINFLWRLTTVNIPKYKDRPDFHQIPQARFDYIGFNMKPGSIFEKKEVRAAFAHSLNFDEFKKAFFALGAPGCPGLGEPLLTGDGHCVEYDPHVGHLTLSRAVKFLFSELGGDDIRRSAEWFQGQWQEHLGVKVDLRAMEQKQFLSALKNATPDAFRKGVMLNRPTCLAGLEGFRKGHPDNYVGFNNLRFENLTKALGEEKMPSSEKASVCGVATDILFKEEIVGVPLGRIHFTMLASPDFDGWKVNELNQLDLSELKYVGK